MSKGGDKRPIVIRRKKVVHAHHGGAWKIALADFMTALMALFLVMWILSVSSEETRRGVAEYFSTPLVTAITGGDMSGSTSVIPGGGPDPTHSDGERARIDVLQHTRPSAQERRFFDDLQERIERAIERDPELRELRNQMRFDLTREGLRIQLLDTEQRPMFELGSDQVAPYMRSLLRTMAPLLNDLPNDLSISGHTDSVPYAGGYRGYSNWELSNDRANASRRELVAGGLDPDQLLRVSGFADRVLLSDTAPTDPINRRIELVVLLPEIAEAIRNPGILSADDTLPEGEVPEALLPDDALPSDTALDEPVPAEQVPPNTPQVDDEG
ncbi:flagellar motor protein MotB [Halomonas sp. CnH100-B]|jgi:chemotaxis protein MotB|uniref:Motility protein MotB n=1 Tax=Vreelandella aquamarina TaxID=77097 RepID=A0A857GG95_9GAMM|nr:MULTISPECIES: flagellar motor protein MotB [Halomonas]MAO61830.1 motility protein MotB [Halomonas sp.]MCO7230775.1 flagellar motor protein MotB [Halomonas sp. CnH100-B]MDK9688546.1 flagellar motor protein MotB [Halomonas sp. LC1]MDP4559208.1 flagellar motor protein MotB [Halomonas meridiana]QHD48292.1 motility protein MotB [Halomonas meridiana]|tara:strand:+ start:1612 stop:2592 length:981 start_codon:yes stop_codon:yes gene_type:complete